MEGPYICARCGAKVAATIAINDSRGVCEGCWVKIMKEAPKVIAAKLREQKEE